jgi:hypothetical protein
MVSCRQTALLLGEEADGVIRIFRGGALSGIRERAKNEQNGVRK